MSVLEGYVEGMINLEGGGGGTSDYAALQNKPSINNVTLEGNKTTEDLNISYDDLQNKPTIRNMPDSSGAASGDVLTHTSSGDQWQPPVEALPNYTAENEKYLKVVNGNLVWSEASRGYLEENLWVNNDGVQFNNQNEIDITLNNSIDNYNMLYMEFAPNDSTEWRHHAIIPVSMIDKSGANYFVSTIVGGNAGYSPGILYLSNNTLRLSNWSRSTLLRLYKVIGVKFNG